MNYYNENEPYAAQWLRNLISAGALPPGDVDGRSIVDVEPGDLRGYTQCHFFAGIGGWSRALDLAGWPAERPVWTGSCPCQPFSVAGERKGFGDDRDLWPVWWALIAKRRPPIIFGEQVASASEWLTRARGNLETLDYAVGCLPIEAASVGAPHKRDRLWIVADADGAGLAGAWPIATGAHGRDAGRVSAAGNWWAREPGLGRVAHGISARMGKVRALGNAVVPQVAAEFIRAYLDHERGGTCCKP